MTDFFLDWDIIKSNKKYAAIQCIVHSKESFTAILSFENEHIFQKNMYCAYFFMTSTIFVHVEIRILPFLIFLKKYF